MMEVTVEEKSRIMMKNHLKTGIEIPNEHSMFIFCNHNLYRN